MTVGLLWSVPHITAQIFVDTPTPPQFQGQGQPSAKNGEWPGNGGDLTFSRYSPLDQINASNFDKLQVAWRFKTDNFGPYPEYKLDHDQGRALHDRRHPALSGRARRQDG
jgi:glucose dehydrogenase